MNEPWRTPWGITLHRWRGCESQRVFRKGPDKAYFCCCCFWKKSKCIYMSNMLVEAFLSGNKYGAQEHYYLFQLCRFIEINGIMNPVIWWLLTLASQIFCNFLWMWCHRQYLTLLFCQTHKTVNYDVPKYECLTHEALWNTFLCTFKKMCSHMLSPAFT